MKRYPLIQIDNFVVSSEIVTEYFCCNYEECLGACCIIGESGAPLEEGEAELIERNYAAISPLMSIEGRRKIEQTGFFEIDRDGDMVTPLLGNSEECAYTRFEGKACFCAIERCHMAGGCSFVKPVSCRLYPIRVSRFSNSLTALNLHRWNLCEGAFAKGRREGIRVYQFLKEPLTDAFGAEFYKQLEAAADLLLSEEDGR